MEIFFGVFESSVIQGFRTKCLTFGQANIETQTPSMSRTARLKFNTIMSEVNSIGYRMILILNMNLINLFLPLRPKMPSLVNKKKSTFNFSDQ